MPSGARTDLRRALTKLVLFPAFGWGIVLLTVLSATLRGTRPPMINVLIMLIPALAFVPGVHYGLKVHSKNDPDEAERAWPRVLLFGTAGLGLFVGALYALHEWGAS